MRKMRWAMAIGLAVLMIATTLPVSSQERDSDGTRMQARYVQLGTTHAGTLNPPDEKADWRMLRLVEETQLVVELDVTTEDRSAVLTLTGATGTELDSQRAAGQPGIITKTLQAGIYYVAVESTKDLRYEISIDESDD